MAAKNCDGKPAERTDLPRSRLYCDGFYARALSNAATNPYVQADNPIDYDTYQRGLDYASSFAGVELTREDCACCAGEGLTVPV